MLKHQKDPERSRPQQTCFVAIVCGNKLTVPTGGLAEESCRAALYPRALIPERLSAAEFQ